MKRNNQSLTTKFSALALVLAMMLSLLAGCGQTTQPAASSTPPAASSEPAASEPETPEIPETMEGDEFGNGAIGTHGGVSSGQRVRLSGWPGDPAGRRQRRGRGGGHRFRSGRV